MPHDAREKKMRSNSFAFCFVVVTMLFGCSSTEDELAADGRLERLREAPASLQSHGAGQLDEPMVAGDQPLLTEGSNPISNDDDCTVIHAWVRTHHETLPTSYRELVRFPVAYRRVIFDVLSPAAKSSLWQQHFSTYLITHPRLSERQVAVIMKLRAHAAIAFEDAPGREAVAILEHLRAEAAELFGPDALPSLIAHLGPENISDAEPTLVSAAATCGCNRTDDWCTWGMRCKITSCTGTTSGCGSWWSKPCNGLCDW